MTKKITEFILHREKNVFGIYNYNNSWYVLQELINKELIPTIEDLDQKVEKLDQEIPRVDIHKLTTKDEFHKLNDQVQKIKQIPITSTLDNKKVFSPAIIIGLISITSLLLSLYCIIFK